MYHKWDGKMIMNDEKVRILKEMAMTYSSGDIENTMKIVKVPDKLAEI